MKKIVFIAKTNLNNDGRILNELKLLYGRFGRSIKVDFILLPDKKTEISLDENVSNHEVNLIVRNSSLFRFFAIAEFTIKSLFLLFKIKPDIVHTQDMAVVLPVYFYRCLRGKTFKLIYDDHEMPNENESLQYQILQFFEIKIMKSADQVIFANKERMDILKKQHRLKNKTSYFLNLPYFTSEETFVLEDKFNLKIAEIEEQSRTGVKFIIHQGSLEVERGRSKLAEFSQKLPPTIKIMVVGVSKKDFDAFISEYNLSGDSFFYVGSVPYQILNAFWRIADAAIVMYLPTYINNRLCAPNRFYIAIKNQLPVLVNKDNPVLNNFIKDYGAGFFIEEMETESDVRLFLKHVYSPVLMGELIKVETEKFIDIYESI